MNENLSAIQEAPKLKPKTKKPKNKKKNKTKKPETDK